MSNWLGFRESQHFQYKCTTTLLSKSGFVSADTNPNSERRQGQPNSDLKVKEISLWFYHKKGCRKREKDPEFGNEENLIWVSNSKEKGSNFGKEIQTPRESMKVSNVRNGRKPNHVIVNVMLFLCPFGKVLDFLSHP